MAHAVVHDLLAALDDGAPPDRVAAGLALVCHAEEDPTDVVELLLQAALRPDRAVAARAAIVRVLGDVVDEDTIGALVELHPGDACPIRAEALAALASVQHESLRGVRGGDARA